MTKKFCDFLKEEGIAETRHKNIYEGCNAMHHALCSLDENSLNTICNKIGIENLIRFFAEVEEMKQINRQAQVKIYYRDIK